MIYTIINQKGGVGKTTTAVNLGAYLSRKGKNVLLIDLDAQCNLTCDFGQRGREPTALELLSGTATSADTLSTLSHCMFLIAASPKLISADLLIKDPYCLSKVLNPIKEDYAHIIIDAPRGGGILAAAALTAADAVIIPTEAERKSIDGITDILKNITMVRQRTNPALRIEGILITRYNGRSIISKQMAGFLDTFAASIGTRTFRTRIRECTALKEAAAQYTDIFTHAPKSNAAKDYSAFAEELGQ